MMTGETGGRYPDHLGAAFDWMSVSHQDMHHMVHNGLNLEVGAEAATDWARLGEVLTDLGAELR